MKWRVFPYKQGSRSAKSLSRALGGLVLRVEGSKWKPSRRSPSVVINWGSSQLDVGRYPTGILNLPGAISRAANKLKAFQILHEEGVPVPSFTVDKEVAKEFLTNKKKVVCRTTLTGHSGEGIVIAEEEQQVVDAPLYVEYIPKKEEYRVHVFRNNAFFIQRKARSREVPDEQVDWQVRNHKNGFIYSHKDIEYPEEIKGIAVNAVEALGLDFGAVDIILSARKGNTPYVLEVNTACGLEGLTVEKYKEAFLKYI